MPRIVPSRFDALQGREEPPGSLRRRRQSPSAVRSVAIRIYDLPNLDLRANRLVKMPDDGCGNF
jgi:hypothetical protein